MKSSLLCHPPPPRMKGVKSLPIIGRPWLLQPRAMSSLHGRSSTSQIEAPTSATPQQRRLLYLYHRMHTVIIATGIIFFTATSIMISFGQFQMSSGNDADSESLQCSEMNNMSSWIQTPVHDQRFFPQYKQLSDFLDGHASVAEIDRWNDDPEGAAICKFRTDIQYWNHFPHAMQQMYRCTSWWLANYPKRQPILLMGQYRQLYKSEFIAGYLDVLQRTIGLQVKRRHKNGAPYPATLTVRPKDTGKWHMDIAITDYALVDPQRQLRTLFLSQWTNDTTIHTSCQEKHLKSPPMFPRIAILNRQMTSGRHVGNARAIAAAIHAKFPKHTVPIVYFENRTFLEQIRFFATETDIVLAPHGAQLTGMAFLPPCAAVLEWFPSNYLVPDFFGSLAAAMNISHSFFYLGDNWEDQNVILPHEQYHFYVPNNPQKDAMQCPNVDKIVDAVSILVQNWQACCSVASSTTTTATDPSETAVSLAKDDSHVPRGVDILTVSMEASSTDRTVPPTLPTVLSTTNAPPFLVRKYSTMGADNATAVEATCRNDLRSKQASWSAFCQSGSRRDRSAISRKIRSALSMMTEGRAISPEVWCAQRRWLHGWQRVMEDYRTSGIPGRPDWWMLLPEPTNLGNFEEQLVLPSSSSSAEPRILARCPDTLLSEHLHLVYPKPQSVLIFNAAALERLLQPIHCDSRGGPATMQRSAFSKWTCWRLWQNHLGEQRFFRNGMSVSDLLFEYSTQLISSSSIKKWHHIGYCLSSHQLLGYFISFYHVTVPDWILHAVKEPNDRVPQEFGVESWQSGECNGAAALTMTTKN